MTIRMFAAATGAVAAATALGVTGQLLDKYNEATLWQDYHSYCYAWRDIRKKRLGRRHQPFRDELIMEIESIARRLRCTTDALKVAVIPTADNPFAIDAASAGSTCLPGAHAYLVVPEGLLLNFSLSRRRVADPFGEDGDIHPLEELTILSPADRYKLAHEMAHLACEHHAQRLLAQATAASVVLAAGPLLRARYSFRVGTASLLSFLLVVPAILLLQLHSRFVETEADSYAAKRGYSFGGMVFWAQRMRDPPRAEKLPAWIRSHPPAAERYQMFEKAYNDSASSYPVCKHDAGLF